MMDEESVAQYFPLVFVAGGGNDVSYNLKRPFHRAKPIGLSSLGRHGRDLFNRLAGFLGLSFFLHSSTVYRQFCLIWLPFKR